nr:reverse transcriptase domain-containing protein [Tanacetum cinerariifolium]
MVSLRVRIQRERVVELKNAPNRDGGRVERNFEGRPSKRRGEDNRHQKVNLSPLLAAHLVRKENGDPDNYLHLFEGAIHMQKWAMLIACHMFTYTLKDSAQIWWNGQKADHGHDTNDCRELRHQIEEAVKSGQLAHLVKGIKMARRRSIKVDSKVPLIGFIREHSWPLGEVPLKITIGDSPFRRTEVLNFVIEGLALRTTYCWKNHHTKNGYRSVNNPRAIEFHTPRGIGTLFSTYEPEKIGEGQKKLKEVSLEVIKGYHQIQMAEEDEDKTAFFAGEGVFCYQKMPFGLKNACATYQRLVDKVFSDQIRRNLEACIDDMETLTSSEKSGQIAKWAIKLGKHDIEFRGRNSVKKHIPKDFSVEMPSERDERIAASKIEATRESSKTDNMWKLYTDRALSFDGSGAGPILISPEGKEYMYALWLEFETKNNEAEYEVLRIAQEMEIKSLAIFVDSVDLSSIDRIP